MISEKLMLARYKVPVITLFTLLFILSGFLLGEKKYLLSMFSATVSLALVLLLIGAFESINRQIAFFFNALRNNDTSIRFQVNSKNKSLVDLYEGMNKLNAHFQSIKMQNEYNENYYKALIQYSASGLMVMDEEERIVLINQTACKYAGIPVGSVNPYLPRIKNPPFIQAAARLMPGEDVVYKQIEGTEYHILSFRASLLRIADKELKIISIHDIRSEMEARELESYRKLISVLTHEIMNLVSPLTSVSSSLQSIYNANSRINRDTVTDDILKTTQTGLQLIHEHSTGLKQFIETYRKISRIPKPVKGNIIIDEWVEQVRIAFSEQLAKKNIHLQVTKDNKVVAFSADKSLMNQVIFNLINNAIDALSDTENDRQIIIEFAERPDKRIRISVSNNGPVIPTEILDKIFVPFFTTKPAGSGIGLSVCQEIVRSHNGSLAVISPSFGMTKFVIEL